MWPHVPVLHQCTKGYGLQGIISQVLSPRPRHYDPAGREYSRIGMKRKKKKAGALQAVLVTFVRADVLLRLEAGSHIVALSQSHRERAGGRFPKRVSADQTPSSTHLQIPASYERL